MKDLNNDGVISIYWIMEVYIEIVICFWRFVEKSLGFVMGLIYVWGVIGWKFFRRNMVLKFLCFKEDIF